MTPLWLLLVVIAEALGWWSTPPASLADAAFREAVRRQLVGPSVGAYSNESLGRDAEHGVVNESAILARDSDERAAAPAGTLPLRTEAWWREQVSTIRERIDRSEKERALLDERIALLETQATARDDPAQQAVLREQAIQARAEIEGTLRRAAELRRDLAQLLEDARRADVPPGWLR
jgi:hypothetical protein